LGALGDFGEEEVAAQEKRGIDIITLQNEFLRRMKKCPLRKLLFWFVF
jgi:hypothetical protein